jgi:hypothetical protein
VSHSGPQDPVAFVGGTNLHAYAGSDPINFGDPSGLACVNCDDRLLVELPKDLQFRKGPGTVYPVFAPDVADELSAVIRSLNVIPQMNDGYRTYSDQLAEWNRYNTQGGLLACNPESDTSTCWHMFGYAVDFQVHRWITYGGEKLFWVPTPDGMEILMAMVGDGFKWGGTADPVHFRLPGGPRLGSRDQRREEAKKLEDYFNKCIPH